MATGIKEALQKTLEKYGRLAPSEQLIQANDYTNDLKQAVKEIANQRRAAVRTMRSDGYTLREIAEVVGTTTQRIHQIESGYNRKEAKARKQAD